MSLLLSDQNVHDTAFRVSDFQFLVGDLGELSSYDSLYNEEHELLTYVARIFGEFSIYPKMAQLNTTNGLLPLVVRIAADETAKFTKETRVWALAAINRGCQLQDNDINLRTM